MRLILALAFYLFIIMPVFVCALEKPELFVQTGHSDDLNAIAFTPEAKMLVSGSSDKTIKLWDIETGREIKTLRGHNGGVQTLAISPDGNRIVSGGFEDNILIWDFHKGLIVRRISVGKGKEEAGAHAVAISPDGKIIAAVCFLDGKSSIKTYDLLTGKIIKEFKGHTATISSLAFSSDGKHLVSGSGWLDENSKDNSVRVWNVKNAREIRLFSGHTAGVMSVSFSSDGNTVASASRDKTVRLWNLADGKNLRVIKASADVNKVTFSPDSKRLAFTTSNKVELINAETGLLISALEISNNFSNAIMFSRSGRHLAVSSHKTLALWDVSNLDNGTVYLESDKAKIYNRPAAKLQTFGGNVEVPKVVYFSSDGSEIKISHYETLAHYNIVSGAYKKDPLYSNAYYFPTFHKRYIRLVDTKKETPVEYIVDTSRDKIIFQHSLRNKWPFVKSFSSNGQQGLVMHPEEKKLSVIGTDNFNEICSLPMLGSMTTFDFAPGDKTMAGAFTHFDGPDTHWVRLWDSRTGKQIRTFAGHSHFIQTVAFTPDGKHLVSGSMDKMIKLWDVATGKEIRTFRGHSNVVEAIAISPDSKRLLSGSWDNRLKLWDVATGKEIRTFNGHTNYVHTVSIAPDGKHVLSGSRDGTTRLWSISTGKELASFITFSDGEWIIITPDGYYNASANGDRYLNVTVGNNVYGIENFRETFFRPDLVKLALAGGSLQSYRNIADVKQPPKVSIVQTPDTVSSESFKITLRLEERGGRHRRSETIS